jgi:hypothetical protein
MWQNVDLLIPSAIYACKVRAHRLHGVAFKTLATNTFLNSFTVIISFLPEQIISSPNLSYYITVGARALT